MTLAPSILSVEALGVTFQNPILLAAGTCGFGRELSDVVDLRALGYPVTAFVTIEVSQGQLATVTEPLQNVPEVIEAHVIAGQGDLLVRLAAQSNDHLMEVLEHILSLPEIDRGATAIALAQQVPLRTMPLVERAAGLS